VTLEETQLVAAAFAALPSSPKLARAVLRELVQVRVLGGGFVLFSVVLTILLLVLGP
jgi:hypothetical protein